MITAQPSV